MADGGFAGCIADLENEIDSPTEKQDAVCAQAVTLLALCDSGRAGAALR